MKASDIFSGLLLITLITSSNLAFGEHANDEKSGGDERVIRRTAPASEKVIETGLNGILQWKKDKDGNEYMILVGPSGLDYEIGKISSEMQDELEPLASKKAYVEIFGTLKVGNGKRVFRVNEIENKKSSEEGQFIFGLKKGISEKEKKDLISLIEQIPTTKVIGVSVELDFLNVKTDLSKKSFFKYFGDKANKPLS